MVRQIADDPRWPGKWAIQAVVHHGAGHCIGFFILNVFSSWSSSDSSTSLKTKALRHVVEQLLCPIRWGSLHPTSVFAPSPILAVRYIRTVVAIFSYFGHCDIHPRWRSTYCSMKGRGEKADDAAVSSNLGSRSNGVHGHGQQLDNSITILSRTNNITSKDFHAQTIP